MYGREERNKPPSKKPKAPASSKKATSLGHVQKDAVTHRIGVAPLTQVSQVQAKDQVVHAPLVSVSEILTDECDTLNLILRYLPPLILSRMASVNTAWYSACETVRATCHELSLHPDVLRSLLASVPDLVTLARCSAVCWTWRAAARAERKMWQIRVQRSIELTRLIPRPYPLMLPFVECVVRICNRCGLDIVTCGGLANSLRFALRALGLLHALNGEEYEALVRSGPQMSVISRPAAEGAPPPPPDEDNTFVIVGVEHIVSHHVKIIADAMAVGLLLISPGVEERDDEGEREARSLAEVLEDYLS